MTKPADMTFVKPQGPALPLQVLCDEIDRYRARIAELEADQGKLVDRCNRLTKDRSEIEATTVERCAQVADATITDNNSWADGRARKIAAAIRALKKP